MSRRNKPRARPRRSVAETRFQLESLEDRTALSAAWGAPPLAPLVHSAVEVRLDTIRAEAPPILGSTAIDTGQAASPVPAQSPAFGPENASSLPNTESAATSRGLIESLVSNAVATQSGESTIVPLGVADGNVVPRSSVLPSAVDSFGYDHRDLGRSNRPTSQMAPRLSGEQRVIGHFFDQRFEDPVVPMSPPFWLSESIGFSSHRMRFPATIDNNETDESLSGPVPWNETDTGILTGMSLTQASGRASGRGSSPFSGDPTLQMNPAGEVGGSSGLLYLATGGWTNSCRRAVSIARRRGTSG